MNLYRKQKQTPDLENKFLVTIGEREGRKKKLGV